MKLTGFLLGSWEVEDQIVVIKVQGLALHVLSPFLADKKKRVKIVITLAQGMICFMISSQ